MTTVWPFLTKFASLVVCTLHCFDRVLFKGHLALAAPSQLELFVDCVLRVRRSHFMTIIAAWVVTVPASAGLAALIYWVMFQLFF